MRNCDGSADAWAERHRPVNPELYLAAVGLAVVFALPLVRPPPQYWRTAGWLAGGVAVVYALLVWAVRRRQRTARQALVADLRAMLMDRVNNHLQVVHASLGEIAEERDDCEHVATALEASRAIAHTVDELSLERLTGWRRRYRSCGDRAAGRERHTAGAPG